MLSSRIYIEGFLSFKRVSYYEIIYEKQCFKIYEIEVTDLHFDFVLTSCLKINYTLDIQTESYSSSSKDNYELTFCYMFDTNDHYRFLGF